MITLFHPKGLVEAQAWEEKLKDLTVTYLMITTSANTPYLREGKKEAHGKKAIDQFLQEYKTYMASWNQDRCDMWFFNEEA